MSIEINKKYLDLINGEKLAYIDKGNHDEVILLIHGNLASSATMITLIDGLKDQYRVIAPDLRGFGDSTFINDFTELKELAFDLVLFCDALGIKFAHVMGWSTGFGVAMELALLEPKLVKSLYSIEGMSVKGYYSKRKDKDGQILKHTIFESYDDMKLDKNMLYVPEALKRGDRAFVKNIWENLLLVRKPLEDQTLLDLYIDETLKQRCQMNINWCWPTFNISNESNLYTKGNSRMKDLKCPIYLTLSDHDNVVIDEMVLENVRLLKNSKVIKFKDAGHCLHMDQLDLLIASIRENLK
ncbi:MAG: alpha/beta hydrolase [Acholeplasmataceae bacterium]